MSESYRGGAENHKCVKFVSISHRWIFSDGICFSARTDWLGMSWTACLGGTKVWLHSLRKPSRSQMVMRATKNLKTKRAHPPNQDPILGTVTGVTDEWGQGVWGKHIPAGGSSATPTPLVRLLGLLFYPFMSHTTSVTTQYTNSMVAPPFHRFFILPTAFPNPHIHPGGKGGQPPASKLPYCSKPVAFTTRIKHIRYIISLHLALPRMLCLNVIA